MCRLGRSFEKGRREGHSIPDCTFWIPEREKDISMASLTSLVKVVKNRRCVAHDSKRWKGFRVSAI
jgi:hypothetical protein